MSSVLITGTSKGIGLETALTFGRAGHTVHATMRNPSASPELAQMANRENLPITVSTMDVDCDQSVRDGVATIHEKYAARFGDVHLGLGEIDSAFIWMDRAIDARDHMMTPIKSYPFLDPLREDSRFIALLHKMNLEP
jgi:NAD(P)-dependent dehydrogenase (short-subunit alcohol dehydrogenase family)